jgi:hypothetical protein
MKIYDIQREVQLLHNLYLCTAKRSLRPSLKDNLQMTLILEELYLLTEKEKYKL